jgi:class 3 adenylate cyclase
MGNLPSGTVTLLFSDIEGSTVLLTRLGDAYTAVLDGQRRVLRRAWAEHGGTEMGTEGDSFFVVFPTAEGAVSAAAQAQRELTQHPWSSGEPVRVRIGIHTGTPMLHDGGYVGMDVHRAARIAGAAHGGQVVVSSVTAELVAAILPDGVGLRDLGCHRLKDIVEDERRSFRR